MSTPQRLIFAGTPEFAATALQTLIKHQTTLNLDIVAVYTQPDRKAGRGQKLTASPVKQLALDNDIPVQQPITFKQSSESETHARQTLASYQSDVMIVAAYGLILPLGVLKTPTYGCLNIHASLLPRWRGAAPIHRAILSGDTQTGVTIMQMAQGLDTGDMLLKLPCAITPTETSASLHDKLADLGARGITTVLQDLANYQAQATPQDESLSTYADKLDKTEGLIDWTQPAEQIDRQIRGLNPWPVAYTYLNKDKVRVWQNLPVDSDQQVDTQRYPAGTVVSVGKKGILVACGDGHLIQLTQLQWSGKKTYSALETANSNKVNDGDRFDTQ